MTTCRRCHAPIRWAVTQAGKSMPLDVEPHPKGNVVQTGGRTPRGAVYVRVLTKVELEAPETVLRFLSHFATCPEASQARRNGRVSGGAHGSPDVGR